MNNSKTLTMCIVTVTIVTLITVFIYMDFGKTIKCYEGCMSSYKECLKKGLSSEQCSENESHCKLDCFNKK